MESPLADCAQGGHFHVVTPLLESRALSQVAGTTVFLKCENVQPAGSFKIRGIGHFCQEAVKKGCRHLVCSSGGNAGFAAAYAARKLGIPATIVLPEGTSPHVVRRLQGEGAEVQLAGKVRTPGRRSRMEWAVPLYPPLTPKRWYLPPAPPPSTHIFKMNYAWSPAFS
uniref:serine dehydratase-like n=1 Tax=Panthera onca TaxID=9690 RepID=UPI0029559532|nr:serine dehydratase-like [Panthera onca]XP_060485008.1 serine dehydratase-like [Panthera onca]XP_060485009.1 serine dehydratase-like [Panthera onca]XP_060485010.1 serine dehydratase-like [Panthera onca]XP_060485011.1 serine dehydratase-like [Panthera onca]XP_060485012.1 serine dehydratase-like [Panthera onca]